MSVSAITENFLHYKTQEAAGGRRVVLDQFVFALIPDLAADSTDFRQTLPPDGQIKHRQAVDNTGMVNGHAVCYSVTLGEATGTFDFNWLGLINRDSGFLAQVIHLPEQKKIRTDSGVQGNTLTYSAVMEYQGAPQATGITTPVASWQMNFSARLDGIDDSVRKNMSDIYGAALFFADGFKITDITAAQVAAAQASMAAGLCYISGVRVQALNPVPLSYPKRPGLVLCLDVVFDGVITGEHSAAFSLFAADSLSDEKISGYTDALGKHHYVQPLAQVQADGTLRDLRPTGNPIREQIRETAAQSEEKIASLENIYLQRDNCLSEIKSQGEQAQMRARAHLGLGSLALLNGIDTVFDPELVLPTGTPLPWPGDTAPPGWLLVQGQAFDTTRFVKLAKIYPSGVLPDLRKRVIKGAYAGRAPLSLEEDGNKWHSHGLSISASDLGSKSTGSFDYGTKTTSAAGVHSHGISMFSERAVQAGTRDQDPLFAGDRGSDPHSTASGGSHSHSVNIGSHNHQVYIGSHSHSGTVSGAGNSETTVKNIAMNFIVRGA